MYAAILHIPIILLALMPLLSACSPSSAPSRTEFRDVEEETLHLVNEYRATHGLSLLHYDPSVALVARRHSQSMALGRHPFSHEGLDERERSIRWFVRSRKVAENLEFNTARRMAAPYQALNDWIASTPHRRTLEGNFDLTGIGVACDSTGVFYFTELFVAVPD
jgi:uncharacterized protein YkwD